jgi:hypothetical protein
MAKRPDYSAAFKIKETLATAFVEVSLAGLAQRVDAPTPRPKFGTEILAALPVSGFTGNISFLSLYRILLNN